jgi:hypothetical protein
LNLWVRLPASKRNLVAAYMHELVREDPLDLGIELGEELVRGVQVGAEGAW